MGALVVPRFEGMALILEVGSSIAGLLVDGDPDTPYTGATLTYTEQGVRVAIPFHHRNGDPQFSHVDDWFDVRGGSVPENMVLETHNGDASLFEVQWSRTSIKSGVSEGVLHPTNTVLATRHAPLDAPLRVKRMRSHIDGLQGFTRLTAIKSDTETDDLGRVRELRITVASKDSVAWRVGDAVLTVTTDWKQVNPDDRTVGGFTMKEWATLTSEFEESQPIERHLEVQNTFQRFLACVVFQRAVHYRRHEVSDEHFPERIHRDEVHYPFKELISRHTVDQLRRPRPTYKQLQQPLLLIGDIGGEGLERWAAEQARWEPFLAPLLQLLLRFPTIPEDFVVTCSIAMEHAGNIIGKVSGERATYSQGKNPGPTTATWMLRCIRQLGLDWALFGSNDVGIAKAIARQYNSTKHYKQDKVVAEEELFLSARLCQSVVRLFSLWIADQAGDLVRSVGPHQLDRLHQYFMDVGLEVGEDGAFRPDGRPPRQTFI
jgi:hypothetical protein